jgi:hypothetical protein
MGLPWKLARPVTKEDLELAKRRLEMFSAIAIQEWLPESLLLFCRVTGWKCDREGNKKKKKKYLPWAEKLGSQALLDHLTKFNKYDIEMYEFAQQLNINQMIEARIPLPAAAIEAAHQLNIAVPADLVA